MTAKRPLVAGAGRAEELPAGSRLATGVVFLPTPEQSDESDATYFYFGWSNADGAVRIERQARATGARGQAQNPSSDFNAAWADRTRLSYS